MHVAAGTYAENDSSYHAWNVGKGISWVADGAVTVRGTTTANRVLYLSGTTTTSFSGFTFDGESTRSEIIFLASGAANKVFTGCTFTSSTSTLFKATGTNDNISVSGSTFITSNYGVYSQSGAIFTNSTFTNNNFNLNAGTSSVRIAGSGGSMTFQDNTFTSTTGSSDILVTNSGNFTFTHNTFNSAAPAPLNFTVGTGNLTIQNNTFTQSTNNKIISVTSGTWTLLITGNTITSTYATPSNDLIYIIDQTNPEISNNIINSQGTGTYSQIAALSSGSVTGTVNISSNTLNQSGNASVISVSSGPWVANINGNTINSTNLSQTADLVVLVAVNSPIVQNNTIDSLGTTAYAQIRLSGNGTGSPQISGNTLQSRTQSAYIIRVGSEGTTADDNKYNGAIIENNTIYGALYYNSSLSGVSTHSIFVGHNVNAHIRYNTVYGGGYGVVVKANGSTYASGGIYYNKFINCTATVGIRIKGVKDVHVYNNTLYTSSSYPSGSFVDISQNNAGETATGAILKNNIIFGEASNKAIGVASDSITGFSSDYNLLLTNGSTYGTAGSSTYNSFAAWQAAGYDTHGLSSNPLFVNSGTYDFRLQRVSPAINLGTDLGFIRDFVNTSVPQGALPDAGAYEYIPLTVTINQASGQSDPTAGSTINYTVVFSESVSDFATGDVTLSGTAGATTATVTGSGTTYNVAVTGMTGSGTVIVSILADKATGATGNTNAASTSSDNTVTYDITGPAISSVSSAQTSVSATVTWTTNENSSSKVDYGLTDTYGSSTTETDTSPRVTSHSVVLSALTSCTTYHFRVRSTDGVANESIGSDNTFTTAGCTVGSSSSSNSSSNSSSATAPVCGDSAPTTAPNLYSAAAQGPTSILLSFTSAGDSVGHYALEFGTETGEYQYSATNIGDKNTRTYLVQSLSPNKTYYFRIRGGNGCATGAWSNEISARTRSFVSANQLDLTESELTSTTSATLPNPSTEGYKVKIKVLDTNQKPVVGAKVTMHSKVQEGITDKDGLVEFNNVEPGDHKVLIAYKNFEGEQSLNLTGDTKEFNLTITVKEKPFSLSPLAYGIIGVMGMIIIGLIVLVKKKRK